MKLLESRVLWGLLLILGGVLFLLENLGILQVGGLFWALMLGLGGLFFLSVFIQNRGNWWAVIPGFTLLGIAALITLDHVAPRLSDTFGGSIVLGAIGLSFLLVYLVDRENWWAIIPMGVLLTLTVVAGLDEVSGLGIEMGGVFFLGLGATFALVALLPAKGAANRWAWIPAGVLGVMGMLLVAAAGELIAYLWPAALILVGGYLILQTLRPKTR